MSSPGIPSPDSPASPAIQTAPPFHSATWPMVLLLLSHAPFVLYYYYQLWGSSYYRFFPLVLAAFVYLFQRRRSRTVERWSGVARFLLYSDLLCLTAALILATPWLAVLGLVLALMAWCLSSREPGYTGSLISLAVIPLTTLRLGASNETLLLEWISARCLRQISMVCHALEVLHYKRDSVLNFSGKSFSSDQLTHLNALFLCLSLAALLAGWQRRSLWHSLALVFCGAAVSICVAIVHGLTVIWLWQRYQIDITSGFGLIVGLSGWFLLVCGVLTSADQFLSVWTFAVPDIARQGALNSFLNPFIMIWNRWMASAIKTPPSADIPVIPLFSNVSWKPGFILLIAIIGQLLNLLLKRVS